MTEEERTQFYVALSDYYAEQARATHDALIDVCDLLKPKEGAELWSERELAVANRLREYLMRGKS